MMKRTILIPTDFSVESLGLVKHAINNARNSNIHFVLTHCLYLTDDTLELLFFSKTELIQSLKSAEFKRGCRLLRDRYSDETILITTELFTGLNQAAFNHFIDANQIDEAVIPKRYKPTLNLRRSFNPLPFIRKSRLKITEVALSAKPDSDIENNLALLANSFIRA